MKILQKVLGGLLFFDSHCRHECQNCTCCLDSRSQKISLNETEDCLAKETAREIYTGSVSATRFVTFNDSVKISADIARKSWQTKWNQDVSGFYTRQLIPEVGTKVCYPETRDIGILYCRLLFHDTILRDDSY